MTKNLVIDRSKPDTVEVELPSYPGSIVTMLRRLPLEHARKIGEKFPKAQTGEFSQAYAASVESLAYAIKDWNLVEMVEGKEKKFDITVENIGELLSDIDVQLLGAILKRRAQHLGGTKWEVMSDEEKKS